MQSSWFPNSRLFNQFSAMSSPCKFNFSCTTVADKIPLCWFGVYYSFLMDPSVTWKYYIKLQHATRLIQPTKTNLPMDVQVKWRSLTAKACYRRYCPVIYVPRARSIYTRPRNMNFEWCPWCIQFYILLLVLNNLNYGSDSFNKIYETV
jgi:hypothetical protein